MNSEIPPLLEPQPQSLSTPVPKWRWAVHVGLLAAYVLGIGLISGTPDPSVPAQEAALPKTVKGLILFCALQMALFAVVFGVALAFSRASVDELRLRWRRGILPVLLGAMYSVFLRIAVAIVVLFLILPISFLKGEEAVKKKAEQMRPKVEHLIEPKALNDPVYFVTILTGVSFIVAGLREELWRAAMLAGLAALFPAAFASRKGQYFAVVVVAVIFGFGHLPQGMGAVGLTALLGLGLGIIMVAHRSIWEAVIAHGCFDAASFTMLWIIAKNPDLLKMLGTS
jgi:membrane protease YdiL (CAAX protease family)